MGGSHRKNLGEFDRLKSDLKFAGIVASSLILLVLVLSFRSLVLVLVVLCPLLVGLLWGFALVPTFFGGLNIITAFLMLILFGMGIDYSIHIVKRYQLECRRSQAEEALLITYNSTGLSVLISGVTTALAVSILAVSKFKGFNEFGIICAETVFMVVAAVFFVLPPLLILISKRRAYKRPINRLKIRLPNRLVSRVLLLMTLAGLVLAIVKLKFDYNLSNLHFKINEIPGQSAITEKENRVFSQLGSPSALFIAPDIQRLDRLISTIGKKQSQVGSNIGSLHSIRDFVPPPEEVLEREEILLEIKNKLKGKWTQSISDNRIKGLIEDFVQWEIPGDILVLENLPPELRQRMQEFYRSGYYLLSVNPKGDRRDGKMAINFTNELYDLALPEDIQGPIGETVVFFEVSMLIVRESKWMPILAILSIFFFVWINQKSLIDTVMIIFPLISGIFLTLGILSLLDVKLNFFNIVVIPALLGLGVDHGVHFYRRWLELKKDPEKTQMELFWPLSMCTATTIMGYAGMITAGHPGLRSIGLFACIGLFCIWTSSIFLLPGLLDTFHKIKIKR